jgi:vacuolar-type H+-ATPase subunit H
MLEDFEKISPENVQKLTEDLDDYIENAKEKGPQNVQKIEQTINQLHDDLTCLRDLSKA